MVSLALRPGFRLKARVPSIEPPGAGDDTSLGKQSSSCRASCSVPDATSFPHCTDRATFSRSVPLLRGHSGTLAQATPARSSGATSGRPRRRCANSEVSSFDDALGYLDLLAKQKPEKLLRAAVRWHGRLSSTALAGSELVAGRRAADHTTDQPAPAQREGREHVRAAIASHVCGRCHPVARCMLGESPDPHVDRDPKARLLSSRSTEPCAEGGVAVFGFGVVRPRAVGPRRAAP